MSVIKNNLVYLTKNIGNLPDVLFHLREADIITIDDTDRINSPMLTRLEKNNELLTTIERKIHFVPQFCAILRETSNEMCADKIEGKASSTANNSDEVDGLPTPPKDDPSDEDLNKRLLKLKEQK